MLNANSVAKLLFLLLLVEVSMGRYIVPRSDWPLVDVFPYGYVMTKWDIMKKTNVSYMANVTIFNNELKNHNFEGPWKFKWEWLKDEILLSIDGVKGTVTQETHPRVGHGNWSWRMNRVIVTEQIVSNCSKGVEIHSGHKEESDHAKSLASFQITVGRVSLNYFRPPYYVVLFTPKARYDCYSSNRETRTRGYINTWEQQCGLQWRNIKYSHAT